MGKWHSLSACIYDTILIEEVILFKITSYHEDKGTLYVLGSGFGIDRMCMLLTDSAAIREVLLFPTMKTLDK